MTHVSMFRYAREYMQTCAFILLFYKFFLTKPVLKSQHLKYCGTEFELQKFCCWSLIYDYFWWCYILKEKCPNTSSYNVQLLQKNYHIIKEHIMCKHVKALYYILTHNWNNLKLSNNSYFFSLDQVLQKMVIWPFDFSKTRSHPNTELQLNFPWHLY